MMKPKLAMTKPKLFVFTALAFLTVAVATDTGKAYKATAIRNLMSKAVPTGNNGLQNHHSRHLDQAAEEYEVNISKYSVKFQQCQFVKSYDDELAQDEDANTVLATKRFVMFRLCPDTDCATCNYNYGEYLVDLETYLQSTVEYFQNYQEGMCNACGNCAADDNGGRRLNNNNNNVAYNVDCSTCYDECQKIENMENNGYVDATEFLECQMIYDPEDDNRAPLYAGPICASSGTKIKIGVFTDENCLFLDSTKDVDDYLVGDNGALKLSHALLKNTYTDTCVSCMEPQNADENNNGNDNQEADTVIELCEQLYESSAKCEKAHGFENGYANYYGYENQLAQESVVCDFMQSLKSGTYDEQGEIIVSGLNKAASGKSTTGGQKFALTFFILGTVGLAVYAAMLHSKLVKGGKVDLSSQGGAMA
jgi:hypothetical protein